MRNTLGNTEPGFLQNLISPNGEPLARIELKLDNQSILKLAAAFIVAGIVANKLSK